MRSRIDFAEKKKRIKKYRRGQAGRQIDRQLVSLIVKQTNILFDSLIESDRFEYG